MPAMLTGVTWEMAEQRQPSKVSKRLWAAIATVALVLGLATWLLMRPPAKVIAVGSLSLPKPIEKCWVETHGKRQALIIVAIEDGQSWQVTIQGSKLVCEPIRRLRNAIEIRAGFFDMDKDGYPEFFPCRV